MKYRIISLFIFFTFLFSNFFTMNALALSEEQSVIKGKYQYTSNEHYNIQLEDSFEYSDECFKKSSFLECSNLETISSQVAISSASWYGESIDKYERDNSYNAHNVIDFLTKIGFEDVSTNKYYTLEKLDNSASVAVGHKKINVSGNDYTLLAIIPRSASYKQEWSGNFWVGSDGIHKGFKAGRDEILRYVKKYIKDNNIEGNLKVWITGHSRGAALSNMLGAFFAGGGIDYFGSGVSITSEDVYCYTYATPTTITPGTFKNIELSVEGYRGGKYLNDTEGDSYTYTKGGVVDPKSEVYNGIHNFISPYDFIALLPLTTWNYTHYGNDISFDHDGKIKEEDILEELKKISPYAYNKFVGGSRPSSFEAKTFDINTLKIIKDENKKLDLPTFVRNRIDGLAHKAGSIDIYNNEKYQDGLIDAAGIYGMALEGKDFIIPDVINFDDKNIKEDLIYSLIYTYLSYASDLLKEENKSESEIDTLKIVFEDLITYLTDEEVNDNTTLDQLLELILKKAFESEEEVLIDSLVNLIVQEMPSDYKNILVELTKKYYNNENNEIEASDEDILKAFFRACVYGPGEDTEAYETIKTAKDVRSELYGILGLAIVFAVPDNGYNISSTLFVDEEGNYTGCGTIKDIVDIIYPMIMNIKDADGKEIEKFDSFSDAADYRMIELLDKLSIDILNDAKDQYGESFMNDLKGHIESAKTYITEIRNAFVYFFLYDGNGYSTENIINTLVTFISTPEAITLAHYNEVYIAYAKAHEKLNGVYSILEGDNQVITSDKSKDLVVKASGEFSKFVALKMDGNVISEDNYTAVSGSTIVTLNKSYLETLDEGVHTLSFIYTDGEADATFTINNVTSINNPETSDNIMHYMSMLCLSSAIFVGLAFYLKKHI